MIWKDLGELDRKAMMRSQFKPVKNWKMTYINKIDANVGDSTEIQARDYIQALEHALYVAGFFLEKQVVKAGTKSKQKDLTIE